MAKRGSGHSLSKISSRALQAELVRRQSSVGRLERERQRLSAKLREIEQQIADLAPGTPPSAGGGALATGPVRARAKAGRPTGRRGGGGRTRPVNDMPLVPALKKLLSGRTLRVKDIVVEVQKAGYKTNSPNFRTIVNQTLVKYPKVFKRAGRGKYTAS